MSGFKNIVGYVRGISAWDYEVAKGQRSKGFLVAVQSHKEPQQQMSWLVDDTRFEAILLVAYAAGQMVSISSHTSVKSFCPHATRNSAKPTIFPLIDRVILPPYPGEPE
jgi:hypothetical protein